MAENFERRNGSGPLGEAELVRAQPDPQITSASGCPICARLEAAKRISHPRSGREARRCDCCGQPIPKYGALGGVGFQSHTPDHFHREEVQTGRGRKAIEIPVMRELCHLCYFEDFKATYPDEPLPWISQVEDHMEFAQ